MPTPEKQRAERLGRLAEIFVAIKLLGSGHRILGWRWRSHYGEIDLIAARGNQIIFTEVKFRAATDASAIPSPTPARPYLPNRGQFPATNTTIASHILPL